MFLILFAHCKKLLKMLWINLCVTNDDENLSLYVESKPIYVNPLDVSRNRLWYLAKCIPVVIYQGLNMPKKLIA